MTWIGKIRRRRPEREWQRLVRSPEEEIKLHLYNHYQCSGNVDQQISKLVDNTDLPIY